ncbi:bifunctional phosphopantothenoylcysteine decarboxylase/phosphopantothenate--cysteine ligase CoaBC [Portibacter lacus]|uniref:Coenzyme A biosynthesis bifunctional protein CoaBC n=1 Tax=Portibacter lacus TaxID=1099794 RepID=A0AA37SSF0_9BACT|nr:bifunctional phosphopantothenoylcysteine decarboxylase/phosphopantothenate--cysteine ligase CoaBC [Portibacter lacus]GLR19162.1 phosphopantothenoylcysteine decarboxylase [Portibacter lacus]
MNIILGITGSIAAYKAAILTRLLVKNGHDVKIIMTEAAKAFISPLTLSTLSKNTVHSNLFDSDTWNNHVELGLWADAMIIAPTTANTLSKMANGAADNMLLATYLSAKCPVCIAPAMDLDMWKHPSTIRNIDLLKEYGNLLIPVEFGELASGLVGEGRMAEPDQIVEFVEQNFNIKSDLAGKRILVTAGPTYEDLDPVRFIGNNSSGKMGVEIAEHAARRGAEVILVQGPGSFKSSHAGIKLIKVRSAAQMYEACVEHYNNCDAAILAAAVADYTPLNKSDVKIKKKDGDLSIALKRTTDIAAHLGRHKKKNQLLIGFALETNNAIENAKGKLERKNFDFIVLNTLEDKGAGFSHDTNKVQFIFANRPIIKFELKSKKKVAKDIIDQVVELF